jgi:hypothetical protein
MNKIIAALFAFHEAKNFRLRTLVIWVLLLRVLFLEIGAEERVSRFGSQKVEWEPESFFGITMKYLFL